MNQEHMPIPQQLEPMEPIMGDPDAPELLARLVALTDGLVVQSNVNAVMDRIARGEHVDNDEVSPRTHGSETTTYVRQRNRRPGHVALEGAGVL